MLAAGTKSENALSEVDDSKKVSEVKETEEGEPVLRSNWDDSGPKQDVEQDENGSETSQSTFSYERLKAHSDNPVTSIDFKRREVGWLVQLSLHSNSSLFWLLFFIISLFDFSGISV